MNLTQRARPVMAGLKRLLNAGRLLLPSQSCDAFGSSDSGSRIEKILVISLDRQQKRWIATQRELGRVLDASGRTLTSRTTRFSAIDAAGFATSPKPDAEINPFYSLRDQLFVEPQPNVLPERLVLDHPIRMSRQEVAVARSHIHVWREIADGPDAFVLVLEDDACLSFGFAKYLERAWREIEFARAAASKPADLLYLSYKEVKGGAHKALLSPRWFRPVRGLWYMSGYVLSREGARKLLDLLPCRGPVDLWVNHQFPALDVRATRRSLITQHSDGGSSNSYSILPVLAKVGLIDSTGESQFPTPSSAEPVFAFGPAEAGLSALAMALLMLGYRCMSDLEAMPHGELARLLSGPSSPEFNAYVNILSLGSHIPALRRRYPNAKLIIATSAAAPMSSDEIVGLTGAEVKDVLILPLEAPDKWKLLCEHLRCAQPVCSFPGVDDIGLRRLASPSTNAILPSSKSQLRHDQSPWVAGSAKWTGVRAEHTHTNARAGASVRFVDNMASCDLSRWTLRDDTFPGNLGLFRPANVGCHANLGLSLSVKPERLGVRDFSAAAVSSRNRFLFGRFEAVLKPSREPGIVTGFFLHRDSPRQEIDVEIRGHRTDQLLVNVYFNPGDEGALMDFGYRGTPTLIDLGFDAADRPHLFTIEWTPDTIRWLVDGQLVHERVEWNPTPIPRLPMRLHLNTWPSRSRELAGRLVRRQLPATSVVASVAVEAHEVVD